MMKRVMLRLGYNTSSHWLPVTLSVCLILALIAWLLSSLSNVQEMAEKTVVEVTERSMRNGLQLAMGEALLHGQQAEIVHWGGGNPVRWLENVPKGYKGECSAEETLALPKGSWCFDREGRELVYVPQNHDHLQITGGATGGIPRLRWRVVVTAASPAGSGQVSLRVEKVTPYKWDLN